MADVVDSKAKPEDKTEGSAIGRSQDGALIGKASLASVAPAPVSPTPSRDPLSLDQLRLGDWVHVKSADAIEQSLDLDGTTEGLPFMPEMLAFCGRQFQIARFANKVCANIGSVEIRQLEKVVVLKVERCDGCFHGGCQMSCEFLWKVDWLEQSADKTAGILPNAHSHRPATNVLKERLVQLSAGMPKQETAEPSGRFFRCQATELGQASHHSSPLHFKQYLVDRKTNRTPWSSILYFLATLLVKKILKRGDSVSGPCKKTPASNLNLQPGDQVRIKSFDEILLTLDQRGCNRGLWFDRAEMKPFCGKTLTVTRRIERVIHEETGELLEMKVPSIVLNETQCSGLARRFCSRAMLHFWREVWLERMDG